MKKDEKASLSIIKIISVCLVIIFLSGIVVTATSTQISNVKIILSNGYEMNVLTAKTSVAEILEENHIVLAKNEQVVPDINSEITERRVITISEKGSQEIQMAKLSEEGANISIEKIMESYAPITEKIVVEEVVIPFETITKDVSENSGETTSKVLTQGKNGLKKVTYKVKYQNNVEIEKTQISEEIITKPVNKVVQINKKATSRATTERTANVASTSSTNALAQKASTRTAKVKTMNTSAYCACSKCCGKSTGITSSGAKAQAWYTLAAGSSYPIGTIIYIPYFKNRPNGGWFVVQDRGGAISNSKIDVFMGTHNQALSFGRRNLECYIYLP